MRYTFKNSGTCSRAVSFDLNDGKVTNVEFVSGCDGNLKAIGKLIDGWDATEVIKRVKGNTCGFKATSCADQLAIALEKALAEEAK